LFRETPLETLERLALGAAWALKPPRHKMLPALARLWLTDLMAPDHALPDPEADLADGLAGIVYDLSVPTLLGAYERGLYPFAHAGPLKWWSAPDRSVPFFDEFHFSNNQRRLMRQGRYTVTFDRDFENVITACAGRRSGRWHLTWITHAYAEAFDAGHAHSFEVWNEKGELAGGGYGLSVGAAFFAESQFSREPNTGKIGMAVLNWHLAKWVIISTTAS
jgi:leucyl/phenylalanyl-tRNA--protein transferase